MNDKNNQKPKNGFDQFMMDQPFDDLSLNIDSRYFDFGVGYNKTDGARLSATIDLNSVGQMTEQDLYTQKAEYQKRIMELNLERQRLYNESFRKAMQEGKNFEYSANSIGQQPEVVDLPYVKPPKKEETKKEVEPRRTPQIDKEDNEPEQINVMGAKAFFDDED